MAMYHAYFTVVLLVIMVGVIFWAYSCKRHQSFYEAAHLPFADEADTAPQNPNQPTDLNQGARS